MHLKRSLLVTAAAATVALGGAGTVGLVSADTSSTTASDPTSLVDKIAAKFNLNKSDVQAVFDQNRAEHQAQEEAAQKARLTQAVTDGILTQAQADHITQVLNEVKTLRGTTAPRDLSSSTRQQIKTQLDDLRTWAKQNNINLHSVMGGMHGRHMGMPDGPGAPDNTNSLNNSSTTTN